MRIEDILNNIISVDELKEFDKVEEKLMSISEGYIFQNNKPTHVIMNLESFNALKGESIEPTKELFSNTDGIEVLLNKIGKKIFIKHYYVFKNDDKPEEVLECEGFTIASCRSRSSSARTIFKNNQQVDALRNVINSNRVDQDTIEQAKELLITESGASEFPIDSDETETFDVKIGKMMRGILSKILENNIFEEDVIAKLKTSESSKEIFNLNFPVIKLCTNENIDSAKRDSKGYNRYYDVVVESNNGKYLICSQWVENLHQSKANQWVTDCMIDVLEDKIQQLEIETEFIVRNLLEEYWSYIGYDLRRSIGKTAFLRLFKDNPCIEVLGKTQHGYSYKKISEEGM